MILQPLHHECLCAEYHQTPGRCLWAPASGLPARAGSAAAQGSTALPAQAEAAQSSPGVPVPSFPLALRTQAGGRKGLHWGVEGKSGPGTAAATQPTLSGGQHWLGLRAAQGKGKPTCRRTHQGFMDSTSGRSQLGSCSPMTHVTQYRFGK